MKIGPEPKSGALDHSAKLSQLYFILYHVTFIRMSNLDINILHKNDTTECIVIVHSLNDLWIKDLFND
jgi:hypothetical protein